MSQIDDRMVYPTAEAMVKAFRDAVATIENTAKTINEAEKAMESGALHGGAGDAFRETMKSKLTPALNRMRDKMAELASDVQINIQKNKELEERGRQI